MVGEVAGVTAGVLSTVAIPQLLLGANNVGTTALLAEGAVALAMGMLSARVGKKFGEQVMVGGFAAMLANLGSQFLGIAPTTPAGLGFYLQNSFPLPTAGSGPNLLNDGSNAAPTANGNFTPAPVLPVAVKKKPSVPGWLPWAAAAGAIALLVREG